MPREITVLLKHEPQEAPSLASRAFTAINEVIKSPLFVFLVGASAATLYPAIRDWLTPDDERKARRAQEQARADAALVAPFIANLDVEKPGQFEASRAALLALATSAKAADKGAERPLFKAINEAIDAVAVQIRPPPSKELTAAATQNIETSAEPLKAPAAASQASLAPLAKDTIVYIQIDRDNPAQRTLAEKVQAMLRERSVVAPGIEALATATMPNTTQVRYFFDADRTKAEALAAAVSQATGLQVFLAKPPLKAKPGTLELWFGRQR